MKEIFYRELIDTIYAKSTRSDKVLKFIYESLMKLSPLNPLMVKLKSQKIYVFI